MVGSMGERGLPALIGELERAICTRLDHIDASLQRLCIVSGAADEDGEPMGGTRSEGPWNVVAPGGPPGHHHRGADGAHHRSARQALGPPRSAEVALEAQEEDSVEALSPLRRCSPSECLCLRPEWQQAGAEGADSDDLVQCDVPVHGDSDFHGEHSSFQALNQARPPWWIVLPNKPFRLFWDLLTGLVIAHDMALVPISLAFGVTGNPVSQGLFVPFLLFWTLDLPLSFLTAIYRNGQLEYRLRPIALSYIRSWFLVDLFVVGSTWMELTIHADSSGVLLSRAGKCVRILRILRLVRFLRILKLSRITEEIHSHVLAQHYHIILTVTRLIVTIVWLNHFIACGWWAVSVSTVRAGYPDSWVSNYRMEGASLDFQYFTSLHWSLTQFTPAGMEVSAKNTPERIYSVCVLLFAMVTFSSFVSSITAAMTQLRQLRSHHAFNYTLLRRYLDAKALPLDLSARILHCVEYRLRKQRKEVEGKEVQYLDLLSQPLKMELAWHLCGPILERHHFLQRYSEVSFQTMQHACLEATERDSFAREDLLFSRGELCEKMFFVVSGQFCYDRRPCIQDPAEPGNGAANDVLSMTDDKAALLSESETCCEVGLWCPWTHRGTMTARRASEVLALDVAAFAKVTRRCSPVKKFTALYAKLFLEQLEKQCSDGLSGIDDMSALLPDSLSEVVDRAYLQETVCVMPVGAIAASKEESGEITI